MEQLLVMDEQGEDQVNDGAAAAGGSEELPVAVTVSEAARLTGATPKAIRRRLERETLQSLMGPDGKRRIPVSELKRAGLLVGEGQAVGPVGEPAVVGSPSGQDMIDRIVDAELRAARAELRLIEEQSSRLVEGERQARAAAEAELHRVRTEKDALEHQLAELRAARRERRTWYGRKK